MHALTILNPALHQLARRIPLPREPVRSFSDSIAGEVVRAASVSSCFVLSAGRGRHRAKRDGVERRTPTTLQGACNHQLSSRPKRSVAEGPCLGRCFCPRNAKRETALVIQSALVLARRILRLAIRQSARLPKTPAICHPERREGSLSAECSR
jgi:hypothetical protein